MYKIGIDLGGTNIAVGITDENYRILCTATTPTCPEKGAAGIVDDMLLSINNALTLSGISMGECRGIGLGSPGTCDSENGVVRNAHNLHWKSVPVCAMLEKRTGLNAYVSNDANCAALGELVAGAAKGCESALMITLGTGVGGGYVVGNQILSGHKTLGGEFGHICIQMDGEPCSCGEKGCWEAYASATALIRQAEKAAKEHPESALSAMLPLDGKKIHDVALAGDQAAQDVIAAYAKYVAVGLVGYINCLYPETVLLGGGIAGMGELLFAPIRAYVKEHFFVRDETLMPVIKAAMLGNAAGIIGAAALVP